MVCFYSIEAKKHMNLSVNVHLIFNQVPAYVVDIRLLKYNNFIQYFTRKKERNLFKKCNKYIYECRYIKI